jgi:hypothetical protein
LHERSRNRVAAVGGVVKRLLQVIGVRLHMHFGIDTWHTKSTQL